MENISEEIASDNAFNICDILYIDHSYLKKCINILIDEDCNKHQKLFYARTFLDTLKKHTIAEKKTVYDSLMDMDEFRKIILEGEIEHHMLKPTIQILSARLSYMKNLDEITEVEIKVLADFVKNHIDDEEMKLFPKMKKNLENAILNEIGFQFMILRKFSPQELVDHTELQKLIYQPVPEKDKPSRAYVYQWSGKFVKKVNRYIGSLVGQSQIVKN